MFVGTSAVPSGVVVSDDGGATWRNLGPSVEGDFPLNPDRRPKIAALALSPDGRALIAATSHGIYRLALP